MRGGTGTPPTSERPVAATQQSSARYRHWPFRCKPLHVAASVTSAVSPHVDGESMATLTAWMFDTPNGADEALAKLEKLNRDYLINLHDPASRHLQARQ